MEISHKTNETARPIWPTALLTLGLALIPFVQVKEIGDTSLLGRHIYLGLTAFFVVFLLSRRNYSIPYPRVFVFALVSFCALYLAGSFTALNTPEAFYTTARIFLFAVWVWLFGILFAKDKAFTQATCLGLLLAAFIGLLILIQEALPLLKYGTQLWDKKNLYELHSAFGHKNLYASFAFVAGGLGLFYQPKNLLVKILKWFAIVLIACSLLLVQTKAVLLGAMLALGLYVIGNRLLQTQQKQMRFGLYLVLSTPLLLIGIIYLFPEKFTLFLNNDTVIERTHLWRNSILMFLEYPFWGVGPGNWQIYFPKYGLTHFMETNYLISDGFTTFQRPHNDFLWVLNEVGIPGLLAFSLLFILALKRAWKDAKAGHNSALGLACLLMGYLLVFGVDFPLERNEHLLLLSVLFASIFSKAEGNYSICNRISLAIPALLLLFSLNQGFKRLPQEKLSKKMITAHHSGDFNRMMTVANAIDQNYLSIDNFSIPVAWYKALYHHALGEFDKALAEANEAYALAPYQVHVINNLAGILTLKGMDELAEKRYKEALLISSVQPDVLLNLCSVQYNQGKLDEAMQTLYSFKPDKENKQYLKCIEVVGMAYCQQLGKNNYTPSILIDIILKLRNQGANFEKLKNHLP